MQSWSVGSWKWLQRRLTSLTIKNRGRSRKRKVSGFSAVPAEIEKLESRELLTVTFHGGAVLASVEAQAVYLGSDWTNNAALQSREAATDQFISTIVQSPYMDMLTSAGYNVGRGSSSAGAVDNVVLNKTTGITDAQIQSDLQAMINAGQLPAPDANRLYIVNVEPGVVVHLGSAASNTTFLGYHGAFAGKTAAGAAVDIHYAVIPAPGAPNFTSASQGFKSDFDEITSVTSHELAEAVTDPNVNYKTLGWYDDQNNAEIGDLTGGHESTITGANGVVYVVQDLVNQNDQLISPASVQPPPPPPPPPTSTLTAPQNVLLTALSTTTARLSWSAVSGTDGYRIFQEIGTQSVLLGTVSAATTSVRITGLTPGARESFVVEAFNATATADSKVISVTMPTPAPLAAPNVTATAISSTSVVLNWNSVSGAQGYRVYWWNGQRAVLLGTVGPSTTAVQVSGLSPSTTSFFLVEAFNSTAVADSTWVSAMTLAAAQPFDQTHHWHWG